MIKSYLDDLIQAILVTHVVYSFKVSKLALEEEDGYIRAKCKLSNGDILEFAEYIQVHRDKVRIETYSFHWQTADGRLVKRWDNVGHHKDLDTYPHHSSPS